MGEGDTAQRALQKGLPMLTIRQELVKAQQEYERAQQQLATARQHRAAVFTRANAAGVTLRQIGGLLGITGQAVHQSIGAYERPELLDAPLNGGRQS